MLSQLEISKTYESAGRLRGLKSGMKAWHTGGVVHMATPPSPDEQSGWIIPADLRLRLLAALSSKPDQRATLSYEDFLAWADENTHAEWVDEEIIMSSPASIRHQRIAQFLFTLMAFFAERQHLGEIIIAPFQMKLAHSGREPDVLFVANAHLGRLTETYLDGPADLVVEVISPDSVGRDRGDKFFEYQEAGIPEYWLIDPLTVRAEFYQLDADGRYQLVQPGPDGVYHSKALPGFWLRVGWLWQDPLPTLTRALRELGMTL
jgi:Uma2 family endonuclease